MMPVAGKQPLVKIQALWFNCFVLSMTKTNQLTTYEGGYHCGAVRFRITIGQQEALDCNCSICHKKGFLHLIIPLKQFTLLSGANFLTTYTFNTHLAKHTFCRICGIHPFYRPRSHPDDIDINLRCIDGNVVSRFRIVPFDGANWEENIDKIRE